MDSDNSLDLPPEILEKLRNLELELEDGDITLKGFEKKKASLLAERRNETTTQKSDAEILAELGPEPSAADVVDFLDYLPSPTHSPTRTVEAVHHMEENHRHIQQQQQQVHYQQQQQQQYYPQQTYYQPQQNQQMRPIQPQYRPYSNHAYYSNSSVPNNRPYMVHQNNNNTTTYSQGRPLPPPGSSPYYRPSSSSSSSSILPQNIMYRPQGPVTTSPRPIYRPRPSNNTGYRPQYVQPNPSYYSNNNMPINRSVSTNINPNMARQQQQYDSYQR